MRWKIILINKETVFKKYLEKNKKNDIM
jgi:hypothetical protein